MVKKLAKGLLIGWVVLFLPLLIIGLVFYSTETVACLYLDPETVTDKDLLDIAATVAEDQNGWLRDHTFEVDESGEPKNLFVEVLRVRTGVTIMHHFEKPSICVRGEIGHTDTEELLNLLFQLLEDREVAFELEERS
jgi:hypothetical protein